MEISKREMLLAPWVIVLAGCRGAATASTQRAVTGPLMPIAIASPGIRTGGADAVQMSQIARAYTMKMSTSGQNIHLRNKYNRIEIQTNGRRAWVNGVMVWLHARPRKSGLNWALRSVDFNKMIDPVLRSYAYIPSRKVRVVVLDPGHGGRDSGVTGARGVQEKQVVLDVARRVQRRLQGTGVRVLLTRQDDRYISLQQRCDFAEHAGADVFVSIHANGSASKAAHGTETYILSAAGFESTNAGGGPSTDPSEKGNLYDAPNAVLGFSLQNNLLRKFGRNDRGVKRARFRVIRKAPCPAALVEMGFISNLDEEHLLGAAEHRDKVALGIADGIRGYLRQVDRVASRG